MLNSLDTFVENHLNLQVRISYPDHKDFLLRHGLAQCHRVLDVGTGNGTFVARLAEDYPDIEFVGIDKRKPCVESCKKITAKNFQAFHVDMFSRTTTFDFSQYDGILMRYFLLHVDNAQKILELFKNKCKKPSQFWVIDLDWSQITCTPAHPTFDKLLNLVKHFCSKISVESRGGQNVLPLLQKLDYKDINLEHIPFSAKTIALDDLALYIKQEIQCYSMMSGRANNDPDTLEIMKFIDDEVRSGNYKISYGMILISASL